jgi:hypothetical protein
MQSQVRRGVCVLALVAASAAAVAAPRIEPAGTPPAYGCRGDGVADDTACLQAALSSGEKAIRLHGGRYRISRPIVQRGGTSVFFDGAVLVPAAESWSAAHVYEIRDEWNTPPSDYVNGQYRRAARTALYGLRIEPTNEIDAVGLLASDGGAIRVQDATIVGCRAGGVHVVKGYEWNLRAVTVIAPPGVHPGAVGIRIDASDSMVSDVASHFYPVGVHLARQASSNVLQDVHVWGMPFESRLGRTMRVGFHIEGGANQFIACFADTPERIDATQPASLANGGVGFHVSGSENTFSACHVSGSVRRSKAWVISEGVRNTLVGCIATGERGFESTKAGGAENGFVTFRGSATSANNTVLGGTLVADQPLPSVPRLDGAGNALFGARAVSPGYDDRAGTAIYADGGVGITRAGGVGLVVHRTESAGYGIVLKQDGEVVGSLATDGAGGMEVRFGAKGPLILSGTGSPEGSAAAPGGSLYLRSDGGPNTTLYVKMGGGGNSGWIAK